jgi:S-DNA-T family DNA segregation ATPase FtsK/SpoIIIE
VVRLLVGPGELSWTDGAGGVVGWPDASRSPRLRQVLARRLARYRPTGAGSLAGPESAAGLPELLGLVRGGPGTVTAEAVEALRVHRRRRAADRLCVPVGVDDAGVPVALDLKESAQGGSGPHGLCIGATGSGKSELLRTLVLGLVATHSSAELNLVLVDFKGGATFLGLGGLPHVSAVITNLADELHLVDRMADALEGELTRRQELLRAAGNLTGVAEYAAARRTVGRDLPPLPALLVVVDEFSELLAQRPELVDLLGTIGRLGRSLGIHLLLASQRLDEGRLRGLDSHLSYRIALRTFSAAESRAVLGVPDAHRLPPAPGSAFLATGGRAGRFRAAYVSGDHRPVGPDGAGLAGPAPGPALPRRAGGAGRTGVPPSGAGRPTVLDTMIAAMVGRGPAAPGVAASLDAAPPSTGCSACPRSGRDGASRHLVRRTPQVPVGCSTGRFCSAGSR